MVNRFIWLSGIFLLTFLMPLELLAQSGGNDTDRRPFQSRGGSSALELDLTSDPGVFFFLDELGVSLSFREMAMEGIIDLDTYKLGPGDLLTVKYEGGINGAMRGILVNPQGDLVLPNIGTVTVEDLTIRQASEAVAEEVRRNYKRTVVSISLDKPRLIKVHVAGDVPFPGVHLVTPQTRLDQALYLAMFRQEPRPEQPGQSALPVLPFRYPGDFVITGGFNMRNIEIERDDHNESVSADLVAYFKAGDLESNPMVQNGDVITVKTQQEFYPKVTSGGAVQNIRVLDYREDDTVGRLLALSGGLTPDADRSNIRIVRRSGSEVSTIPVAEDAMDTPLLPNDRVIVPFDKNARQNQAAWVHGEANFPGHYPIEDGVTTALELYEMAGGANNRALREGAFLIRPRPARTQYGHSPAIQPEQLQRASDQYLQGFEYIQMEAELSRNEVYIDLTDREQMAQVRIYDSDQLHIPRDDQTVFLMGQVNNPGYYPLIQGRSVSEYIQRAGGKTIAAEEDRVFVIKAGNKTWLRPDQTTVQSGDIIFVDRVPYDDLQSSRAYDIQRRQQRNSNIQLIMTGLTTITGIITTYVAITR